MAEERPVRNGGLCRRTWRLSEGRPIGAVLSKACRAWARP